MATSGYSSTPLSKKLGIKDHFVLSVVNPPDHYFQLFTELPGNIEWVEDPKKKKDLIHYFAKEERGLVKDLLLLKSQIRENGMIWISWPKKASGVKTDLTEDLIRSHALKSGLVDIKVCAVDETWSGLKLVIPVKDRKKE
jgi:Protein of unknown function (DUF3052)